MRARPGTPDTTRAVERPQVAAGGTERAEGVVQDAYTDAGTGSLDERVGEALARRVVADDVVLEMHPATRGGDRGEHRLERARAVGVKLQAVALDRSGARRAVDREGERVGRARPGCGRKAHPTAPCGPRPRALSAGPSA